jgi:hypothetical protein
MIETHECLLCKKTISRKNNFCGWRCRHQYNDLHKTNIGISDWDYIDAKIPHSKFWVQSSPLVLFPLKFAGDYFLSKHNFIFPFIVLILWGIYVVYILIFMIRFYRL